MLSIQTPAKINLFLNILQRRPDGYHEIRSVLQAVRLWDRLDLMPAKDGQRGIRFSCNVPALDCRPSDNLVVRAYHLFGRVTGIPLPGLNVHLEKTVPMQAGLGGGSANAAGMLLALNHLTYAGLSPTRLRELAACLGSDVPFFIEGGLAMATGRGESIEPLPANLIGELPLVIVKPLALHVETAMAYRCFAESPVAQRPPKSPDHLLLALKRFGRQRRPPDPADLELHLMNDFEAVLFPICPPLAEIAQKMRDAGIRRPMLSGSGSAFFGFSEGDAATRHALETAFPADAFQIFWTRTWPGGILQSAAQGAR